MASVTGTTPLGVFAESAAGIEQGAKTGLAAIINGILFLFAFFYSQFLNWFLNL